MTSPEADAATHSKALIVKIDALITEAQAANLAQAAYFLGRAKEAAAWLPQSGPPNLGTFKNMTARF